MIDSESLARVAGAQWGEHFIRPIYDDYGFAQIPRTVRSLLLAQDAGGVPLGRNADLYGAYDQVILFFVDAFGWRFFEQFADHPFLRRIRDEGFVSKLTSQFPSTTAAHVTTIHTGLPVGQSGVYEWYYYEPLLDALIAPLLFSYAGDGARDTLAPTGITGAELFPTQTIYRDLAEHGVQSFVFQDHHYALSPYTTVVSSGATVVPYRSLPEAIVNLAELRDQQRGKAYFFLYYASIDTICHLYGPESPQIQAEIETFLDVMERLLLKQLTRRGRRTLFLMTADHGQTAIDPATTVYLNRSLPELTPLMKTDRAGQPLVPAGSSRDLFLHIEDERLDEAQARLEAHFAGKAEIHRVGDLIEEGFFGPGAPSETFLGRVGDLVILPYAGESVWWYQQGKFEQNFRGSHGGLTRDEMETSLLIQPLG
jgi:hypothetical protein